MAWQFTVVMLAVLGAVGYLAWSSWKALAAGKGGCSGGCGCSGKADTIAQGNGESKLISRDSLMLRRKKQ